MEKVACLHICFICNDLCVLVVLILVSPVYIWFSVYKIFSHVINLAPALPVMPVPCSSPQVFVIPLIKSHALFLCPTDALCQGCPCSPLPRVLLKLTVRTLSFLLRVFSCKVNIFVPLFGNNFVLYLYLSLP